MGAKLADGGDLGRAQDRLTLASTSPQRRAILERLRIPFEVVAPDYVEHDPPDADPVELVRRHAEGKARSVHADGATTLGVDTTVVLDGRLYGKAADREDAARILGELSDRTHTVLSGVCLLGGPEDVVAHERTDVTFRQLTPETLAAFCERHGAEPAEGPQEAGAADVVVTATTSRDPVLRGDWLSEGALVCAIGANDPRARELDNVVLQRASFVCCDSREQSRLESGDLIEPVAAGVLDWLEVHELQEVVAGGVAGRAGERDVVVFKSNGIAAWDVAAAAEALRLARERGVGRELP